MEKTLIHYKKAKREWNKAIRKDPNNMFAWLNKGKVELILQEGKPKYWLRAAEEAFSKVLELNAGKLTEDGAEAWYKKAEIWKTRAAFNPYIEKEDQIKNLENCLKCLETSLGIKKSDKVKDIVETIKARLNEVKSKDWNPFISEEIRKEKEKEKMRQKEEKNEREAGVAYT